jgi:glycerol-3-phosphate dehydrogenase
LGNAKTDKDLGLNFGATLTEREVLWLITKEYAQTADDIIWRRSKLGLRLSDKEIHILSEWINNNLTK